MKIGYSISDNEIYNAEDITYQQAKALDILCPCCFENIIKCVRPLSDGRQADYLSHRPTKDPEKIEQNKICEARVLRMTDSEKSTIVSEKRGQSLAIFMQNIEDKISDTFKEINFKLYMSQHRVKNLSHKDSLVKLHTIFMEKSLELSQKPNFINIVNKTTELFGGPNETQKNTIKNLSIKLLKDYSRVNKTEELNSSLVTSGMKWAEKILEHLKTEQGNKNYNFLLACSVLRYYLIVKNTFETEDLEKESIKEFLKNSDYSDDFVLLYVATWTEKVIINNKPHKGMEFIEKLAQSMGKKYENSRRDNMEAIEISIFENIMLASYTNISMMPLLVLMKEIKNIEKYNTITHLSDVDFEEENINSLKI